MKTFWKYIRGILVVIILSSGLYACSCLFHLYVMGQEQYIANLSTPAFVLFATGIVVLGQVCLFITITLAIGLLHLSAWAFTGDFEL